MIKPDNEYKCMLGIYEPLSTHYYPRYKYDSSFNRVITTPADAGGCVGATGVTTFNNSNVRAILVARPFRSGGEAVIRYTENGSQVTIVHSLYSNTAETPRLIWLPEHVTNVVFNVRVEDMGYEPSWYDNQNVPITDDCDQDFINSIGLYFMYDASPYYSKLELVKEQDSQATSGRFLRDKFTTDITFRASDFDKISAASEYAICAVVFCEKFSDDSSLDNLSACCYFNRASAEINFSECYVKPDLKTLDNYSWILDKYSTEKNIVRIQATTEKVSIPIPPVLQFYLMGSDAVTNICNDSYWEQQVSDPDVSARDLRKMGFMPISYPKISSELSTLVTTRALNIVLTDEPYIQFSHPSEIVYLLNIVTGEYSYETTRNYDTDPTDAFPYDRYRFRGRNGMVECYDSETGVVVGSKPYSGVWPPYAGGFATAPRDFMEVNGKRWGCYSANIDYNVGLWARILCHSETESDRYAIGDFASLSKWYNKLAYPVDFINEHKLPWENRFMFKETNDLTRRPTEYGYYDTDQYYTNENLPLDSYLQGVKPMPVFKSWWGTYSYWIDLIGDSVESWLNSFKVYVDVKDCFTVDSVVRRLLNSYGLAFEFNGDYNSSRLLYGQASIPNYLKLDKPYLVPSTNLTRGKYTQAAQKAMLSLKGLLDEICMVCNAGWHIDKDGLHIEGNEWYDAGRSYNGINYSPSFDFEDVVDEFNRTNTLYGQIVSLPETDKLWHTLSMETDDNATRHFANTEMLAKSPFCKNSSSLVPKFSYDLLEVLTVPDNIDENGLIMLGTSVTLGGSYMPIDATSIYDVRVGRISLPVQARIMNRAFSWPYLKGRHMFRLPADRSLIDFGWLQSAEYFSTLQKAYTMPHRAMKIRMPVVSEIYTQNWQLVKTTLGYGVVSRVDIDLITRVATITVDIIEYNL